MKKWILRGMVGLCAVSAWAEVTVTNLVVVQREGTKLVDITYDVSNTETNTVLVSLIVSNGASAVACPSVTGDVGWGVATGMGESVVWDMAADWNGNAVLLQYTVMAEKYTPPEGCVFVEAGTAAGGSPTISDDFYIAKFEVTNEQMRKVMQWAYDQGGLIAAWSSTVRNEPGNHQELLDLDADNCQLKFSGSAFSVDSGKGNYPCGNVTWYGAVAYCNYLSAQLGLTVAYNFSTWELVPGANGYRLPSEAQWEYAARGGKDGSETEYSGSDTIGDVAWYSSNSGNRSHEVGTKTMNELGTYDMSGNMMEWCYNWYPGLEGRYRERRGGGWLTGGCHVWYRSLSAPGLSYSSVGFRPVMPVVQAGYADVGSEVASLFSDARDYTLTVSSDHGSPAPSIGMNTYAWKSTVTCHVEYAVSERTNSICVGWVGAGSVPSAGSMNSTGSIVLTNLNSSITWNWPVYTVDDLWAENVSAAQRVGTKLVDVSYDLHSMETNVVDVAFSVSNAQGSVSSTALSGDFGSSVSTGTARVVVWDAGADWDGNVDDLTFRISGQYASGVQVETPAGRVRIPAGQNSGDDPDDGAYSLTSSNALFMDASEVTKGLWDGVAEWAVTNGYVFANAGGGSASNHPVHSISWVDAAMWCNARSELEGFDLCYNTNDWSCDFDANGYRLPTAAEWQYAARGGLSGKRFPWGDTITHSNANYYSSATFGYDTSVTRGFHPTYGAGNAPEASGTENGYGLYAMAGNVKEWCNDESGGNRVLGGSSWQGYAPEARCFSESWMSSSVTAVDIGFRTVRRAFFSDSILEAVEAGVDTRDYLLSVVSGHGNPVPGIGTNVYAWYAGVTCSVESASVEEGVNWKNQGWSGLGAMPLSGMTNSTGLIVLTNIESSISWDWGTDFVITNATVAQVEGEKVLRVSYDIVSDVTNAVSVDFAVLDGESELSATNRLGDVGDDVLPGVTRQILWDMSDEWNGNFSVLTCRVAHATFSGFQSTASGAADSRDYLLTVSSEHGNPVPSLGMNAYAWRASVTCSVESVVMSGLTNWTSAGWSGSGSIPPEGGTPNVGDITLTSLTSSVLWNWDTNYWMAVSPAGSGSIDPESGWKPAGSNVQVQATTSNGWLFMGWSGDASGDYSQESIIVPMVRPVSITATFSDDADDDGLLNTNETALGTDPRKKDTDGDGSDDPDELIAGTSPTNSVSVLAVELATGGSANELSWFGVSGRYYQLEYIDNLGETWTPKGTVVSGTDAIILKLDIGAGEKRFYRIRVSDNPANL